MKNFMKIFPKIFTKRQAEEGLTFYDLLVAMIVSFIFLMVTLQLTVSSAMIRVRAKEKSEAVQWITEDSDYLKYLASTLGCNSKPDYDQYAQDLIDELKAISDPELIKYKPDAGSNNFNQTRYLGTVDPDNPKPRRKYTFTRKLEPNSNVLKVSYYVDFDGDTKTCNPLTEDDCVTVVDMEITPNAAFGC